LAASRASVAGSESSRRSSLGFGTVFFYAAQLGTTWFFAHVVAVGLTIVAVGIALRADRQAVDEARVAIEADSPSRASGAAGRAADANRAAGANGAGGAGALTVSAIVMELNSSGGDNAMIYGGFPAP